MAGMTEASVNWPCVPAGGMRRPPSKSNVAFEPMPRKFTATPRVAFAAPFCAPDAVSEAPRPTICGSFLIRSLVLGAPVSTMTSRSSAMTAEPVGSTPRMRLPVTTTSLRFSALGAALCANTCGVLSEAAVNAKSECVMK